LQSSQLVLYAEAVRRWLLVGSLFLVLAAPATAAQPAWKGLINDWYDGHIDRTWPCSAYRAALAHLPDEVDTYSSAKRDLERNLREGKCVQQEVIHIPLWIGPKSGTHTERWPFYAAGAAALLLTATALGLRRARRPTRS
jgi:hypothetical protein